MGAYENEEEALRAFEEFYRENHATVQVTVDATPGFYQAPPLQTQPRSKRWMLPAGIILLGIGTFYLIRRALS